MISIEPIDSTQHTSALKFINENGLPVNDVSEQTMLFGMFDDKVVIGTIGLEMYGEVGLLRSLAVCTKKRSTGIGKRLVGFIEKYASDKGVRQLLLLTTTAEGFFQELGYKIIPRNEVPNAIKTSSEFSTVCPSSALVLQKEVENRISSTGAVE